MNTRKCKADKTQNNKIRKSIFTQGHTNLRGCGIKQEDLRFVHTAPKLIQSYRNNVGLISYIKKKRKKKRIMIILQHSDLCVDILQ